jgi:hypothetical protein
LEVRKFYAARVERIVSEAELNYCAREKRQSRYWLSQFPIGLWTLAVPPLLLSHTGAIVSLPCAVAPPVACAETSLPSIEHDASASPFESAVAVVLHAADVLAFASPSSDFAVAEPLPLPSAEALDDPWCVAVAFATSPGEVSASALPPEDETALAWPPLAFTVERLRESEIAFPTPLLDA